jgi:hypothetical protein
MMTGSRKTTPTNPCLSSSRWNLTRSSLWKIARDEIESKIMSLTMQAQMQAQPFIDEANALGQYLDERER